jgi:hypothetical protein
MFHTSSRQGNAAYFYGFHPMKKGINSSNSFGTGAIRIPIRSRIFSNKSITGALYSQTNNSVRMFPDGRRIAGSSISYVATILVDISGDELSPPTNDQEPASGYEVYGRITTPTGWITSSFERSADVTEPEEPGHGISTPEGTFALEPGPYELAIAVRDIASGNVSVKRTTIKVPTFEELVTENQERKP